MMMDSPGAAVSQVVTKRSSSYAMASSAAAGAAWSSAAAARIAATAESAYGEAGVNGGGTLLGLACGGWAGMTPRLQSGAVVRLGGRRHCSCIPLAQWFCTCDRYSSVVHSGPQKDLIFFLPKPASRCRENIRSFCGPLCISMERTQAGRPPSVKTHQACKVVHRCFWASPYAGGVSA